MPARHKTQLTWPLCSKEMCKEQRAPTSQVDLRPLTKQPGNVTQHSVLSTKQHRHVQQMHYQQRKQTPRPMV